MIEQLRMPPCSVEAEQAVIGGAMISTGAYLKVAERLQPEDFYRRDHQLIWAAIAELAGKNLPFDAVTIGEWFEVQGLAEQIGGGSYLIELASTTPSAANIVAYADIVREKSLLRRVIEVGTGIVNDGFQPDGREANEVLAAAIQSVFGLMEAERTGEVETGKQGLARTLQEFRRRLEAGDGLLGIGTSLEGLDELLMGFQDTDLVILAGRPSMGKTALMLQMDRAAAKAGKRPLAISMEMSAEQVYMRHIAAEGRVDFAHVQRPSHADIEEMTRIRGQFSKMQHWDWYLDDTPSMSVQRIAAKIRRMKRQHNIGIVFIDYLQFIDMSRALKNGNTASALQEVTRTLKSLAKELKIPIVLLSQLNRALESRQDKRPIMADLRESGAIEQDADVVIFVHRQGYFERDWAEDDPRQLVAEIIVAKQRNGKSGTCRATWIGRYQQFNNMAHDDVPEQYIEMERKREERGRGRSGRGFQPTHRAGVGIESRAGCTGED